MRYLFLGVGALLLFSFVDGRCDCLLHFTGGDSISVSWYKQTAKAVMCEYAGGTIKVPISRIRHITSMPTELRKHRWKDIPRILFPGPLLLCLDPVVTEDDFWEAAHIPPIDLEAYNERERLKSRLQENLETFRRASRHRDLTGKKRAIEAMARTSAHLSRLR